MKLYLRIFVAYFLLLGLAGYYLYTLSVNEIKPAMRQSGEEILVDVANLLAETVEEEFSSTAFEEGSFVSEVDDFLNRSMSARIFSIDKSKSNLRIYITDSNGIVRYYSGPESFSKIGSDYSQWNDVYLTLQGKYGARSTEDVPGNVLTSVMYVAAPIIKNDEIIGVLTVGKPGIDIQPFIEQSINNLKRHGLVILFISLALGIVLSYWLTHSIRGLTHYAKAVSEGKNVSLPKIYDSELKLLGNSMEEMRVELEGKNYVEQYVHSLTHELKSPISAIDGASELISQGMDAQDFEKLKANIVHEASRLNDVVNRLLDLVRVEKLSVLEGIQQVSMREIIEELIETKLPQCSRKGVEITVNIDDISVMGDRFLLRQCVDNLLQNALDFSLEGGAIVVECIEGDSTVEIVVSDEGEGIPDYAIDRIFERFYSLQRPNGASKSSGIGLSFVKQVVKLHHGELSVFNKSSRGVMAKINLPT